MEGIITRGMTGLVTEIAAIREMTGPGTDMEGTMTGGMAIARGMTDLVTEITGTTTRGTIVLAMQMTGSL
jgi:hypothetical protein